MPCKLAPHKSVGVSESHRVKMIELCAQNNDRLIPELIELTLPSPSYTVKTLRALKEKSEHLGVQIPRSNVRTAAVQDTTA